MSFYSDRILPHLINRACSTKPTRKQREKIVPRAYGDVLEIGFGGGLNLRHYDRQKVRRVFGLEPSEGMRNSAVRVIAESDIEVELIGLPGEEIPLDDNAVDSVLVTYTLCTIPDVVTALQEMRRVLKDIQSGAFTSEWIRECHAGQPKFKATRRMNDAHPIEEVGERLRGMMPWIAANQLVDKEKN